MAWQLPREYCDDELSDEIESHTNVPPYFDKCKYKMKSRHSNEIKMCESYVSEETTHKSSRQKYNRNTTSHKVSASAEFRPGYPKKHTRLHDRRDLESFTKSVKSDCSSISSNRHSDFKHGSPVALYHAKCATENFTGKSFTIHRKLRDESANQEAPYQRSLTITSSKDGKRQVAVSSNVVKMSSSSETLNCSFTRKTPGKFSSEETSSVFETSEEGNSLESSNERESSNDDCTAGKRKYPGKYHNKRICPNKPPYGDKTKSKSKVSMERESASSNRKHKKIDNYKPGRARTALAEECKTEENVKTKSMSTHISSSLEQQEIPVDEFSSKHVTKSSEVPNKFSSSSEKKFGFGRGIFKKLYAETNLNMSFSDGKTGHDSGDNNQQRSSEIEFLPPEGQGDFSGHRLTPLKEQFSAVTLDDVKNIPDCGKDSGHSVTPLKEQFSAVILDDVKNIPGCGRGILKKLLNKSSYSHFKTASSKSTFNIHDDGYCRPESLKGEVSSSVDQTLVANSGDNRNSSLSSEEVLPKRGIGRGLKLSSIASELGNKERSPVDFQTVDCYPQKFSQEAYSKNQPVIESVYDSCTEPTVTSESNVEIKEPFSLIGRECLFKKGATSPKYSPSDLSKSVLTDEKHEAVADQNLDNSEGSNVTESPKQESCNTISELNFTQHFEKKEECISQPLSVEVESGQFGNISTKQEPSNKDEPEDTSSYLSDVSKLSKFGLLGKFMSKILTATVEDTLADSADVTSKSSDLESAPHQLDGTIPEATIGKQLSDKKECSLKEDSLTEQCIEESGNTNVQDKQHEGELLANESFNSSKSALANEKLDSKYYEDGTTSTSELNKDSDNESISSGKKIIDFHREDILSGISETGSIVHGDFQITMISKASDLHVHKLIMKNLEYRRISDLTRCQKVAIPIVADGHNLTLISPPGIKKTSAWLIPLLNNLLNNTQSEPKKSPKCVILVPGSNRVRYIARLCSAYVGAKLITIGTHGGGLELERKDELLTGVDILISTPRCCLRLFKSKSLITPDRLRYFVIDSVQDIFKRFSREINIFKRGIDNLTYTREKFNEDSKLQLIMIGTTWTDEVENFALHWIKKPVICITSYLEAAVYSKVNIKMHIVELEAKVNTLVEMIIKSNNVRTVIVCCDAEDVKQLRAKLCILPGRTVLVAHEEMHSSLLPDVKEAWITATNVPILICTDFMLSEINISNAKWLIHYTIPPNKSNFRDRFGFIKDFFIDRVKNDTKESPDCIVDLFIDEITEGHLPKIVELLDRLHVPVSEEVRTQVQEVEKKQELSKSDVMFCDNILQFGQCWKSNCKMRHIIIPTKDAPQLEPPIKSFITMDILNVISPTHLVIRINSYSKKLFSCEQTTIKSNFLSIAAQLAELYMDNSNRCMHGRASIGDIVGVAIKEDVFARGKILEITKRDVKSNATEVYIYLLDQGICLIEKTDNLLSLPVELQVLPGEAVNIYITGLVPLDLDHCWSYTASKYIEGKIKGFQNENRNITIIGQVELIIGKNILLEKVLFYEEPPQSCTIPWLIESLRQLIISSNFGILNHEHKKILRQLAKDAGITFPEETLTKVDELPKERLKEEIRWAYFLPDIDYMVNVIIAEDIDTFFVRPISFQKCLTSLENDLNLVMMKYAEQLDDFNVGTVCAVKIPGENKFNRGLIIEPMTLEILDETEVEVLIVDYGERLIFKKTEVFMLPEGFISRLPFQAIECGLAGIKPVLELEESAVDALYDLTSDNECWNAIFLKVIKSNTTADLTGGSYYDVVLIDTNGDGDVLINEEMVKRGFAHWKEDMKEDILSFKGRKRETTTLSSSENVISNDAAVETNSSVNVESRELCQTNGLLQVNWDELENVGFFEHVFPMIFPKNLSDTILDNSTSSDVLKESSVVIKEITEEIDKKLEENRNNKIKNLPLEEEEYCDYSCRVKRVIVHSPTVYWRQSSTYIWLKILLPDIKRFKMHWTDSYINFQTMIDEKLYWVDIDLFGSINPDTVMHKITGLYFEIRLTKCLTGFHWPRIFYNVNTKARGIIHDPDKVVVEDDGWEDKSLIPSYIARSEVDRPPPKKSERKLYTKFDHHALEDGSGTSGESDIDDFNPIPDGIDSAYEE